MNSSDEQQPRVYVVNVVTVLLFPVLYASETLKGSGKPHGSTTVMVLAVFEATTVP